MKMTNAARTAIVRRIAADMIEKQATALMEASIKLGTHLYVTAVGEDTLQLMRENASLRPFYTDGGSIRIYVPNQDGSKVALTIPVLDTDRQDVDRVLLLGEELFLPEGIPVPNAIAWSSPVIEVTALAQPRIAQHNAEVEALRKNFTEMTKKLRAVLEACQTVGQFSAAMPEYAEVAKQEAERVKKAAASIQRAAMPPADIAELVKQLRGEKA